MDDEASNLSTFDIYSDLLEQENRGVSVEQLQKTNAENEAKLKELTEQLRTLQEQNTAVVKENTILRTNISQLFKTAEAELKRKDRQLEELADERKPRCWRENDLKSTINGRLRDLRKSSRLLQRRSNGVDHGDSSRDALETKPCDSSYPDRQEVDTRKVCKPESGDQGLGSRSTRYQRKPEVSSSGIASDPLPDEQKTKSVNEEKHTESIAVNSNDVSIHSSESYRRKDNANCGKRTEKHESERPTLKQSSLSNYRIPKKSTSRSDHPVTSKEDARCAKSLSEHRESDSSHRSSHSPSRSTRDSVKLSKYNHSPAHDHSTDPSKSGRLERTDISSRVEGSSRRKRRLSSEIASSTPHDSRPDCAVPCTAPSVKKHKLESTVEVKGRGFSTSDKRKSREDVTDKLRRSSKKAVASPLKVRDGRCAGKEESSRKRHTSDRKNRSLKRARETLHKMHSTPRKDKYHKESERHMRRKRHSINKHYTQSKDSEPVPRHEYVSDKDSIDRSKKKLVLSPHLEDGEILDSDIEDTVKDVHQERWPDAHDVSSYADSKASDGVQETPSKEQFSPEGLTDTPLEIDEDVKSEGNISVPERTTTQEEDFKTEIIPTEIVPKERSEVEDLDDDAKVVDNAPDLCSTPFKTPATLTQPDPAACVYASEHETVLICMPSQDEDLSSEGTSQSVSLSSSLSSSRLSIPNIGDTKPELEGNIDEQSTGVVITDEGHQKLKMEFRGTQSPTQPAESESPVQRNFESISSTKKIESFSDASDLQTSPNLDGNSLTVEPMQRNTDDSFRERILSAFGSTSFLDSDDLESSKEAASRSSVGFLEPQAPGASQLQESFAQTVLDVFGGDSLLGSDDLHVASCSRVPSGPHQDQSKSEEAVMLQVEEGLTSSTKPQAEEQSTSEHSEVSSLAGRDAVSVSGIPITEDQEVMDVQIDSQHELSTHRDVESIGSQSIETDAGKTDLCPKEAISTQGDDQAEAAAPHDGLNIPESDLKVSNSSDDGKLEAVETRDVLEDCTSHTVDEPSSASHSVSEKMNEQGRVSKYPSVSDTPSPGQKQVERSSEHASMKDEQMKESSEPEGEDVVDISIDLPSFDALSCSASPAHSSLLGDSDGSSHHSNLDEQANWDGDSDKPTDDCQRSDRDDKCDVRSQFADQPQNGTPSETSNLSDGEVVSSSDSDVEPPSKSPVHRPAKRRSKQSRSEHSRRRSRPREDRASRQKDRGSHSSKYSKGTHSEVSDRAKFLEGKRRAVEERRKLREVQERQHTSHSGGKPRGDAIPSRDRKDHKDEKKVLTGRDVHGKDKDYRHPERKRTALREESNSRHSINTHSSRRYDSDHSRSSQRKPERRESISEQRGRDNGGRDQRRRRDY